MPYPNKTTERRAQILDGLYAALADRGSLGTSVTAIAEAAGIARSALHYYFASKDEIRQALMEHLGARYTDGLAAYISKVVARNGDAVRALVDFHVGPNEVETMRLMRVWVDFWGAAATDPTLAVIVAGIQARARASARIALVANGAIDDDATSAKAIALLAAVEGALLQMRIAHTAGAPLEHKLVRDGILAFANRAIVDDKTALSERHRTRSE